MSTVDQKKLEEYHRKLGDVATLSHTNSVIAFGYYLQAYAGKDVFQSRDIEECYYALDMALPKNIPDVLAKAENSGRLLYRNTGYRVTSAEAQKIRTLLEEPQEQGQRIEKVYKPGEIYDFYTDVKSITSSAKSEVFIIDGYANEDVIDLYLSKLDSAIKMMILTNNHKGNFLNVANKFKLKHQKNFVVRTSSKCHDRLFFVDKKCFVVGQSIDKAASDKPTYLVGVANGGSFRQVFQQLFDSGKTLV